MEYNDDEYEGVANACEFALLSIRNGVIPPVDMIRNKDELETFLGTISGIMAGWGMIIKEKDEKLYKKLLSSLEKMALKHG